VFVNARRFLVSGANLYPRVAFDLAGGKLQRGAACGFTLKWRAN
jgi:hypothetical protein